MNSVVPLLRYPRPIPLANGKMLKTEHCAFIMGSLNVSSDSFWSESRVAGSDAAIDRILQMVNDGADLIDIGAESTRPGAKYVSAETELDLLLPVITAVRRKTEIPISIDTRKSAVMSKCFAAGADILNDVAAMEDDVAMPSFVAKSGIPVVLMHKKGNPESMQYNPVYCDPVADVEQYLLERATYAESYGVDRSKILLDPGIGFGKTKEHNRALIASTARLSSHGYQLLMAVSRKSFIGDVTGRHVDDRLAGTVAANLFSVAAGAAMIRVHDVKEARDSLNMLEYLAGYSG